MCDPGRALSESVRRNRDCWDNIPAESFWSTFKMSTTTNTWAPSKTELVAAVDQWIRFYNSKRRHSAIGMRSPDDYEKSLPTAA
ncbi:integrase core domain-containing protein [Amycolatopsis sp. PS_44_ISF1]|uniref:integrase core domain-containing protein n=1 Tax=Amycolatopsis sp. PS_44_ISF1 TaxID=2974917 RepID=UPI0037BE538A